MPVLNVILSLVLTATPASSLQAQMDAHFTAHVSPDSPGFAVGLVQDGVLVAEGYYGLASLEHGVPVQADTRFYIGSISKQFTAALILKRVLEGALSLSDPVRTYLPELHPVYDAVTVADCLYHTGGIREYTSLMLIRGDDRSLQDVMGQADALALIARQSTLDFEPGSQQRYSSSGYVVLAAILERLEGGTLAQIADAEIFTPLGMASTQFDTDSSALIPHRADSYRLQAGGWSRWIKSFDVVGDGGVLTTVRDMARWDAELRAPTVFTPAWANHMRQAGRLRDGTPLSYGGGLQFGAFHGQGVESHGGGMGGFIADQIRFPDLGLSLYVFANRNDSQAFQGWRFAETLAPAAPSSHAAPALQGQLAAAFDGASDWVGAYFSDSINNRRYLRLNAEGGLDLHNGGDEFVTSLLSSGPQTLETPDGKTLIHLHTDGLARAFTLDAGHSRYTARRYSDAPPEHVDGLANFEGWYCSPELEAKVQYRIRDGVFEQRYAQSQPEALFPEPENPLAGWNGDRRVWTGVTMVRFDAEPGRPAHQVVIGDLRVSGVVFERCAGPGDDFVFSAQGL